MKPDDISKAMKSTRPCKRVTFIKTAAAVAGLCIVFTLVFGCSRKSGIDAYAISEAAYPEMAPYPDETAYWDEKTGTFDSDAYSAAYSTWFADRQNRMNQVAGYTEGLETFYAATMREFLSGSEDQNLIYSPLNIYMAMSMLAETTDGASRRQILDALGAEDIETLRLKASALWKANYCNDGATTSILANSIWLNQNISFKQPVMDLLASHYFASSFQGEMGSDQFNQMIRDWINEQTGGLLKEQAGAIEFDRETIMALASTVYYQAKWSREFSESATAGGIFHSPAGDITCDFMHQSESLNYCQSETFSAVSKPLSNSGSMWFILPDERVGIDGLLADEAVIDLLLSPAEGAEKQEVRVNLAMPKFDVSSDIMLKDGLVKLGVTDVFDSSLADFSPLTEQPEPVFLSEADHAARVMVDEQGCTAAAYTVMMMDAAEMLPADSVDFVLDRPFMFVITGMDGTLLFAGVVNQPV